MSNGDYSEFQVDEEDAEDQTTDEDIYCEALADTLHHVALPVTVGFYAPWGRNKRGLLNKIEKTMKHKSEEEKDKNKWVKNKRSQLLLFWRMIFYLPVFDQESFEGVQYIFINFDVWKYTGCDRTWAGLVTALLEEIEEKNKYLFSFVRVFGKKRPERGERKKTKWVLKKWSKFFIWGSLCVFISLLLCIALLWEFDSDLWMDLIYLTIALLVAIIDLPIILPIMNILCTAKKKLQKAMNRKDLSSQLGFMHSVKEEVNTIIKFLPFMARREGRDIRVVLKITSLDRCAPDKVVEVLDAINILLCNEDIPFISILAADPSILVECIEKSSNTCCNGYLYLDRIVSLPFSLPKMSQTTKQRFLRKILKTHLKKDSTVNPDKDSSTKNHKKKVRLLTEREIEHMSRYLHDKNLDTYFPGNSVQMKRIVNTVRTILTMVNMGFRHKIDGNFEKIIVPVIDWVILANCWPCRLSWILQCEEDQRQQNSSEDSQKQTSQDPGESAGGNQQRLLGLYEARLSELDNDVARRLLELDGDPDLFRIFLQRDHFIVGDVTYFSDLLINLDFSLKRRFELLRGHNAITRSNKNKVGS